MNKVYNINIAMTEFECNPSDLMSSFRYITKSETQYFGPFFAALEALEKLKICLEDSKGKVGFISDCRECVLKVNTLNTLYARIIFLLSQGMINKLPVEDTGSNPEEIRNKLRCSFLSKVLLSDMSKEFVEPSIQVLKSIDQSIVSQLAPTVTLDSVERNLYETSDVTYSMVERGSRESSLFYHTMRDGVAQGSYFNTRTFLKDELTKIRKPTDMSDEEFTSLCKYREEIGKQKAFLNLIDSALSVEPGLGIKQKTARGTYFTSS